MPTGGAELIRLDRVYKIFGPQPRGRAFELSKAGLSKNDVQLQTGHVVGLTDVNFTVGEGEIFVVMGLSGSGKSTAIRTVNKLHDATHGEVFVDGVDVQKLEGSALQEFRREKMGMVFQHFALFPHRSVIENAAYGLKVQGVDREERLKAAMGALDMVGLANFARSAPSELSGGMQQRVGLARALASDPDVLLMDEAFSALDPLIRRQMQDEMMAIQLQLQKTILFITHDLNEALRIGDRVCIMKDGAVVQIGTPEEILTKPATGYVAEFVQDVDQGRVIEVNTIMTDAQTIGASTEIDGALAKLSDHGAFIVDNNGVPMGLLTAEDGIQAQTRGAKTVAEAMRADFTRCTPETTLNEIYADAGSGQTMAVCDEDGKLVACIGAQDMMRELGRVESLIDGFERELYM